jgi:serine/threonine-protein kinase
VTTQSAPAVAPALPSVQVASEVELVVESDPEKVEVFVGEKKLGVAPGPFKLPKSSEKVTLVLKASGYASRELEITPLADRVVSVRLDKGPRTGKPPPAGKKPEVEF